VTSADVLVVAGGGGAAYNAGSESMGAGGAGGLIYAASATSTAYTLTPSTMFTVTVGAGGLAGTSGSAAANGLNSIFGTLTATGGGAGGRYTVGAAGGSGGGGGNNNPGDEQNRAGGVGVSGQGYAGASSWNYIVGGGGGGAGSAGGVGGGGANTPKPGIGKSVAISGTAVTYAVGGAAQPAFDYTAMSPVAAYPNVGGGGRSAAVSGGIGGAGATGVVIVRYSPAPGTPSAATAVAGDGRATVTVSVPGTGGVPASYTVRAVQDTARSCTVTAPATTCVVTGLTNGTPYTFEYLATNTAGSSAYSPPSNQVIPLDPTPPRPATPSDVTATAGVASVSATWTPVARATWYTVVAEPGPSTCTSTEPTCVMGGVAGTSYTVTVTAHSSTGNSTASEPSNAVTPTGPPVPDSPPPSVPLTLTTDKGQIALATPGQDIIVIGTGFAPYSTATVIIYSTPIPLGTVTTDGSGSFSVPVTIPAGLDPGAHTFLAAGIDPAGGTRQLALPVTVAPSSTGSSGDGGSTQTSTVPVPSGGGITLLDAAGVAATTVVVPEGTYALDATTGIISFVPISGFTGTATPVTYRVTDAIGTVVTGTYTAVITGPAPPPGNPIVGRPALKLPSLIVSSPGNGARVAVPCRISTGTIARCTVTATAMVSGRRIIVARGETAPGRTVHLQQVTVHLILTALGRSLAARPGGAALTFTAVVLQRGHTGSATARGTTRVLAATFTLPRAIHFGTDSHTVGKADNAYLRTVRGKLGSAKVITCVGHADSRGGSKAARLLGTARAKAVCAIIARGLHATIHTASKGDRAPIGSNRSAAGRAFNRRVNITIQN
jgi:CshA-type fibril repeat protein